MVPCARTGFVDGYQLTQGFVRDIETRQGHRATTARRGDPLYSSGRHGTVWRPRLLDASEFTLNMWIGDTDKALVEQWFDELLSAVMPLDRLCSYRRDKPDSTSRTALGMVIAAIAPIQEGNTLMRVGFSVRCPSGRWQDTNQSTAATVAGAAVPQTLPLAFASKATAPMDDLLYKIDGPISNPQVLCVSDLDGASVIGSFTYSATIPAGQWLQVDSSNWSISTSVGIVGDASLLSYTGVRVLNVPSARPGVTPTVKLLGGNNGSGTRLTVTGKASYLT